MKKFALTLFVALLFVANVDVSNIYALSLIQDHQGRVSISGGGGGHC